MNRQEKTRKNMCKSVKLPFGIFSRYTVILKNDCSFLCCPHGIVKACHHVFSRGSYQMDSNALYPHGKVSALELGIPLTPPRQVPLWPDTWPSPKLLSPSQSNLKMHQSITRYSRYSRNSSLTLTFPPFETFLMLSCYFEAGATNQPLRPPWAP